MTTDKTPTDAEIAALRAEFGITSNGRGIKEFTQVVDFARAVLAKWGSPVVAGEPEGWITWWPTAAGVRDPIYSHGPKKPSHGAELDARLRKYPLYTTPQPTQAQAGAVPQPAVKLGPDGKEWAKTEAGYAHVDEMLPRADGHCIGPFWYGWALRGAFVAGAEWQEARHTGGIKEGGQHG